MCAHSTIFSFSYSLLCFCELSEPTHNFRTTLICCRKVYFLNVCTYFHHFLKIKSMKVLLSAKQGLLTSHQTFKFRSSLQQNTGGAVECSDIIACFNCFCSVFIFILFAISINYKANSKQIIIKLKTENKIRMVYFHI